MCMCDLGPACYGDVPSRCQAVGPEPVPIGCESLSVSHVYSLVSAVITAVSHCLSLDREHAGLDWHRLCADCRRQHGMHGCNVYVFSSEEGLLWTLYLNNNINNNNRLY